MRLIIIICFVFLAFAKSSQPLTIDTPRVNPEQEPNKSIANNNIAEKSTKNLNQGRIFNEHGPSINFNSYSYQNEPKNKEESNHLIEIVNCLFTALLAIFTGILAKATIRLFKMAEAQNKTIQAISEGESYLLKGISDRDIASRERIERAYIFVNFTKQVYAGKLKPILWIQNYGKTPATLKTIKLGYQFGGEIIDKPFCDADHTFDMPDGHIISPMEMIKNVIEGRDFRELSEIEIDTFNQFNTHLHITGIIEYHDIFGNPQKIEFDWVCRKNNNGDDFIFYISADDRLNKHT